MQELILMGEQGLFSAVSYRNQWHLKMLNFGLDSAQEFCICGIRLQGNRGKKSLSPPTSTGLLNFTFLQGLVFYTNVGVARLPLKAQE